MRRQQVEKERKREEKPGEVKIKGKRGRDEWSGEREERYGEKEAENTLFTHPPSSWINMAENTLLSLPLSLKDQL